MFKPKKPIPPPALTPRPAFAEPHEGSPVVVEEPKSGWRCKVDGQANTGKTCTTCGAAK